ncbi:MAG: hypothetical protein KDK90_07360 [Leptospiraceae bacterium]|nr:hypothetical protein [Leptospiraceae bacterium]
MKSKNLLVISLFLFYIFIGGCSSSQTNKIVGVDVTGKKAKPATTKEIAPLSYGSIDSQKSLYNEGWYIIPSSKKALEFSKKSITTNARTSLAMALINSGERARNYPGKLGETMKKVDSWKKENEERQKGNTKIIYYKAKELSKEEAKMSKELFQKAYQKFVLGNLSLRQRTEDDRKKLAAVPKNYYQNLKGDFSNLYTLTDNYTKENESKIKAAWSDSFSRGKSEFLTRYEKSGASSNSLTALGQIFRGYAGFFKEVALLPPGQTVAGGGKIIMANSAFLLSSVAVFSGRTLAATGLAFFYPVKLGYQVISPTLESGFLTAMGILSAGSTVPTIIGGTSLAAVNQVTVVGGYAAARTTGKVGGAALDTGETVAGMVYDTVTGLGKTVFYSLQTGVVLGYTALTALPVHLLVGASDGVIFLVYDGPRLAIAKAKGNIKELEELPPGTVIDIKELKKEGIDVEVITDEKEVIQKVLQKQKDDLKENKDENNSKP